MSAHRFFLTAPLPDDAVVALPLSDADVRHAVGVLRVREGEEIEVVEPGGAAWRVLVAAASPGGMSAEKIAPIARGASAGAHVTLFQGVAKGEKMDAIVRQAVEVGADALVPVFSSRTVVRLDARKTTARGERWRRVAEAAAKQAHRERVPEVADAAEFALAVETIAGMDAAFVLWEECTGPGLADAVEAAAVALGPHARIGLVVGPEGGFSAEEVVTLQAAGAVATTLGPNILRTETAAVVALALAIHALGGLGRERR